MKDSVVVTASTLDINRLFSHDITPGHNISQSQGGQFLFGSPPPETLQPVQYCFFKAYADEHILHPPKVSIVCFQLAEYMRTNNAKIRKRKMTNFNEEIVLDEFCLCFFITFQSVNQSVKLPAAPAESAGLSLIVRSACRSFRL